MSQQSWSADEDNPAGPGGIADRRSPDDPAAWEGTEVRPDSGRPVSDPEDEDAPQSGEAGGHRNLAPDPPDRPSGS